MAATKDFATNVLSILRIGPFSPAEARAMRLSDQRGVTRCTHLQHRSPAVPTRLQPPHLPQEAKGNLHLRRWTRTGTGWASARGGQRCLGVECGAHGVAAGPPQANGTLAWRAGTCRAHLLESLLAGHGRVVFAARTRRTIAFAQSLRVSPVSVTAQHVCARQRQRPWRTERGTSRGPSLHAPPRRCCHIITSADHLHASAMMMSLSEG